jgi:hypothetical protein
VSEAKIYRTLFISDIHLGSRNCQADLLLDFLRHHDAETIYLVGDIFDGWRLKRSWYWPQSHNDIVQKLLRKARKGTRVIYIPATTISSALMPGCFSVGLRSLKTPSTNLPTDGAFSSSTGTSSISWHVMRNGWLFSAMGLTRPLSR